MKPITKTYTLEDLAVLLANDMLRVKDQHFPVKAKVDCIVRLMHDHTIEAIVTKPGARTSGAVAIDFDYGTGRHVPGPKSSAESELRQSGGLADG